MGKVAITGARLIDPACSLDTIGDIFLADGVITAVGAGVFASGIPDGAEHIEADGLIVCPGLIDMRVVTGEPGAEHKETIASAGQAAAAGGVTSMVIMPNTDPVIDDISLVDYIRSRGKDSAPVRVYVAGALTKGLSSTAMTELGLMASAGAVMFSNADNPIADTGLMRRIMAYSSTFNALIAHRPVDPSLQGGGCAHES
ncbi:MAG TPA: dihydroorotase, partial [Hellea balneolensis]|nr:dihydroorotase [Hellea balneolensis]